MFTGLFYFIFFSLGASIVVQSLYIPRLYAQLVHNPLCVFLFEEKMPFETDDPAVSNTIFDVLI